MKKITIATIIILFYSINAFSQNNEENLNALFDKSHARGVFTGSVLVAKNGEIIFQKEYGFSTADKQQLLNDKHRYSIGSIAKEFNAVGIMILQQENKLQLDDLVSKFLPELPPWSDSVQVKHLLTYTSGLPNIDYDETVNDSSVMKTLTQLKKLKGVPGQTYLYSNNNVFLQKRIIEKLSGQTYPEFVWSRIFQPCGITNAIFDPNLDTDNIAKAFDNDFVADSLQTFTSGWPYLTATDLFLWAECLHKNKVISPDGLIELFNHFEDRGSSLGNGLIENDTVLIHEHHGSDFNYESILSVNNSKRIIIILLTNNKNFQLSNIVRAVYDILDEKPFDVPKKSIYLDGRTRVLHSGAEQGIVFLKKIRNLQDQIYDVSNEEDDINDIGYFILRKDRLNDAIEIFKFNTQLYPNSPNTFDSLGEAYLKQGNKKLALKNYKKVLKIAPGNKRIQETISEIEKM